MEVEKGREAGGGGGGARAAASRPAPLSDGEEWPDDS
jgi:hypothetical protein